MALPRLAEILALRTRGLTPKAIARQLGLRSTEVSFALQTHTAAQADNPATLAPLVTCLLSPAWGSRLGLMDVPGVPHFLQGPRDDVRQIVATLERTVGKGQFYVSRVL